MRETTGESELKFLFFFYLQLSHSLDFPIRNWRSGFLKLNIQVIKLVNYFKTVELAIALFTITQLTSSGDDGVRENPLRPTRQL